MIIFFQFVSKICFDVGLSGHLLTGIQAAVTCARKEQGARLAVFLSESELDAFKALDQYSADHSYWLGKHSCMQTYGFLLKYKNSMTRAIVKPILLF